MRLNVSYTLPTDDLFGDRRTAVLTDEHAACSYGQPVVIVGGVAHGPAELPVTLCVEREYAPLTGDPALYQTDEQIQSRETPASRDLVARAAAAGFRIG